MNRVIINLEAISHNLETIGSWMRDHGSTWTVVTKVLCGHQETLSALTVMGVRSLGDSRLRNLVKLRKVEAANDLETWYLRIPNLSAIAEVTRLANVSLNSETAVIKRLNQEAAKLGKRHRIIIMIELGDLREGILPGSLVRFYQQVFELPNIEVIGIGSNLGCLSGQVPTIDQYMQLVLYRELLELKFGRRLPLISAGSSVTLPLLLDGQLPRRVNHFRVGESLFLGNNLINGETLPGLRTDTAILEAEIVEVKEKSLLPTGAGGSVAPFGVEGQTEWAPGQRGYRVLINVGHLDTDIKGLRPEDPAFTIAGGSSDIAVVNVGDQPGDLAVGGTIRFTLNYASFLRLMAGSYIPKIVFPPLADFAARTPADRVDAVPPVLSSLASPDHPTLGLVVPTMREKSA